MYFINTAGKGGSMAIGCTPFVWALSGFFPSWNRNNIEKTVVFTDGVGAAEPGNCLVGEKERDTMLILFKSGVSLRVRA